jgi:uncharacterized protein involved in tolerance to divalent cations
MSTADHPVLIYATVPDKEIASDITATLLTLGLAASVSYWDGMTSVQMWGGELHSEDEVGMIMFTRASLSDRAIAEAVKHFPNATGPFVVIDASGGQQLFLDRVMGRTAHPST